MIGTPTMADVPEQIVLNRYHLQRVLGTGGMGRAYLARQISTNRQVVVKVMHEKFMAQQRFHDLFEREMALLKQLQHPNIVALTDSGVDPAFGPCIVMEYLNGLPLSDVLTRSGHMPPLRAGRLVVQLCAALQAAADRGIIHRDLKPSNLMVLQYGTVKERLKVLDFGLAKLTAAPHLALEELQGVRRLVAVGTPEYICPEQVHGNEMDHRGDIYSVGVILYELLTGRRPFDAPTDLEILEMHARANPPPFANVGITTVPAQVEAVVMSCLAKYPAYRPQTARELAARLEEALGEPLLKELFTPAEAAPHVAAPSSGMPSWMDVSDPKAVVYHLQAWMPENIAVIKLRGFLSEAGASVEESAPGLVRVTLTIQTEPAPPPPPPQVLVWLRLAEKPKPPPEPERVTLVLHMTKKDPARNLLQITVVLTPQSPTRLLNSGKWIPFCDRICDSLCQYLMATKVQGG
jgi:serine/threonine-protein kinase